MLKYLNQANKGPFTNEVCIEGGAKKGHSSRLHEFHAVNQYQMQKRGRKHIAISVDIISRDQDSSMIPINCSCEVIP